MKKLTSIAAALVLTGTLAACSNDSVEGDGIVVPPDDSTPTATAPPDDSAPTTAPGVTPPVATHPGFRSMPSYSLTDPGFDWASVDLEDEEGTLELVTANCPVLVDGDDDDDDRTGLVLPGGGGVTENSEQGIFWKVQNSGESITRNLFPSDGEVELEGREVDSDNEAWMKLCADVSVDDVLFVRDFSGSAVPVNPAPTTPVAPPAEDGSNFETSNWVNPGNEVAFPSTKDWNRETPPTLVTGIRSAEHDNFDRVVLDLDANEQPGWLVKYDDLRNVLEVEIVGVPYPAESDQPARVPVADYDDLDEVDGIYTEGPFEGHFRVLLEVEDDDDELNDDAPKFRVMYLEGPARLVIDVQDD